MNVKQYPPIGFTDRLYEVFISSGIELTELAKRTGIARSSLYYYLYNDTTPNVSVLARLCKALDVSADYLLFGKEV